MAVINCMIIYKSCAWIVVEDPQESGGRGMGGGRNEEGIGRGMERVTWEGTVGGLHGRRGQREKGS